MQSEDTSYVGKTAYHGDIAANYERDRTGEAIWAMEQEWVDQWIQSLPRKGRVLDIPVGTGRFTDMLLKQGLSVHASDISDDMLKIAAQRGSSAAGQFTFSRDDVESLPFADDGFDYVISWRLFHLLPPQVARNALCELARVCRGRLVIQFFGVEQCAWWRVQARRIKRFFVGAPTAHLHDTPWSHICSYSYSPRGLVQLFTRCGLRVIKERRLCEYGGTGVYVYVLEKRRNQR